MKAQISNGSCWVITENENLTETVVEQALRIASFSILGILTHKFTPHGYTKLWLLGESHAALHSFPEERAIYVEISSCVKEKYFSFWNILNNLFVEENIEISINALNSYNYPNPLNK